LVVCKQNKVVVDSFPDETAIQRKMKTLASKVMDKKAKARFWLMDEMCLKMFSCHARKLELPNKTLVAAMYRMFISVLRSKRLLTLFIYSSCYANSLSAHNLTNDKWQLVAEFEAVLRNMNVLAMEVQTEMSAEVAMSWYMISICRAKLQNSKRVKVFDIDMNWTPEKAIKDIPTVLLAREELMPTTRKLLLRLDKEFDFYFAEPDSDQMVAMILHPVMAYMGMK
jgi:hypothetical protein